MASHRRAAMTDERLMALSDALFSFTFTFHK
jgi:hypothetical protein